MINEYGCECEEDDVCEKCFDYKGEIVIEEE